MPIDKDKVEIYSVEVNYYKEDDGCNEVVISWNSNIGFGEYCLSKSNDNWYAYSEHMDTNKDKWFIKKLMDKFIENLEIKG